MLTTKEIIRCIIDNGYPFELVDFGNEYPDEAYCIRQTKTKNWEVYYSEKGFKTGLIEFCSESEACEYLIKKIKTDHNTELN